MPTGVLGFEQAVSGDEVSGQVVLARIIEPASKLDRLRVPGEAGVPAASYAMVKRRLPGSRRSRGGSTSPRRAPRTP
jgi:hypothetical protein